MTPQCRKDLHAYVDMLLTYTQCTGRINHIGSAACLSSNMLQMFIICPVTWAFVVVHQAIPGRTWILTMIWPASSYWRLMGPAGRVALVLKRSSQDEMTLFICPSDETDDTSNCRAEMLAPYDAKQMNCQHLCYEFLLILLWVLEWRLLISYAGTGKINCWWPYMTVRVFYPSHV